MNHETPSAENWSRLNGLCHCGNAAYAAANVANSTTSAINSLRPSSAEK